MSGRERYWIDKLNSRADGYNASIGGLGRSNFEHRDEEIVEAYMECHSIKAVAKKYNCDYETIRRRLYGAGMTSEMIRFNKYKMMKKPVTMHDMNGGFICRFDSLQAAADYLMGERPHSAINTQHITEVCRGERRTAYGYKWKFTI